MSKQKISSFRGRVAKNIKDNAEKQTFGYLVPPKNVNVVKNLVLDKNNKINFDIIPYIVSGTFHPDKGIQKGDIWYKRPFGVHRNIGSGEKKTTVICPQATFGKKCPICEHRIKIMKEGAPKDEFKLLYPSIRNLYYLIPIGSKDMEEKIVIWDSSNFLFQELLEEEIEFDTELEVFPDIDEGMTLQVRFREESMGTSKYYQAKKIEFVERDHTYDLAMIEALTPLDEVIKEFSYKEIENMFFDIDAEEIEEIDETEEVEYKEVPVLGRKKNLPVIHDAPAEIEDDDEMEDAEVIDDDDDIPPPKKQSDLQSKKKEWDESLEKERQKKAAVKEEPKVQRKNVVKAEAPAPPPKQTSKNKCPHGHVFGVDTDDHKECNSCKIWDECIDEKESN